MNFFWKISLIWLILKLSSSSPFHPNIERHLDASAEPTVEPTFMPSAEPTSEPTVEPTLPLPTFTSEPTIQSTEEPTIIRTIEPTREPTTVATLEPTKELLIENPTYQPSSAFPNPTVAPLGIPTTVLSRPSPVPAVYLDVPPTVQPTNIPTKDTSKICVRFIISDTFGDGRDSSRLFIYDKYGHYVASKCSCGSPYSIEVYCFDTATSKSGDTVSATMLGYNRQYLWQVLWTADIENTRTVFTGSYMTTMTFEYRTTTDALGTKSPILTLSYAENLLTNTIPCTSCRDRSTDFYASGGPGFSRVSPYLVHQRDPWGYSYDHQPEVDGDAYSWGYDGYDIYNSKRHYYSPYIPQQFTPVDSEEEKVEEIVKAAEKDSKPVLSGAKGGDKISIPSTTDVVEPSNEVNEEETSDASMVEVEGVGDLVASSPAKEKKSLKSGSKSKGSGESKSKGSGKSKGSKIKGKRRARKLSGSVSSMVDYSLYGKTAGSWFTADRYGTDFYISDTEGYFLFYSGTSCASEAGSETPCDLRYLGPGTYLWRVTGFLNPNRDSVGFNFCGVRGSFSTEVMFLVDDDGSCVPLHVRDLNEICSRAYAKATSGLEGETDSEQSYISFLGSFEITGQLERELSAPQLELIRTSLQEELSYGMSNSDDSSPLTAVEILSSTVVESSAHDTVGVGRRLHELKEEGTLRGSLDDEIALLSHLVNFKVTIILKDFGIDYREVDEINRFQADLTKSIQRSMHLGVFNAKIRAKALQEGVLSFQTVGKIELKWLVYQLRGEKHERSEMVGGVVLVVAVLVILVAVVSYRATSSRSVSAEVGSRSVVEGEILRFPPSISIRNQIHNSLRQHTFADEDCTHTLS